MRHTLARRATILTAALGLALTGAIPVASASASAPAAPAAAKANAPVTVTLTVRGPDNSTLFNGPVATTGHTVTTASGGTHKCDGTNNGANPTPGATPTAALDDAAKKQHFTWDGTWYPSFDDYFVTTVAGTGGGSDAYWNISVNGTPTPVGGCQFRIKAGDKVAFTWTKL
ncbi:DUF4430 domain-containing protein [Streptomyces sp. MST-110588]|uniref:DUF4430 domain-containing protein n=1 Tax=Streptomyces sp. MST-110588 TaxID=2833628 RepID=UPI001F5CCA9B|nr:DUF4430 domain-containing protein [Streptomyces sp. MST-110588]UNO41449.1 DUF4430 domain-containing protein [Streptomyces sp. MST-110588]